MGSLLIDAAFVSSGLEDLRFRRLIEDRFSNSESDSDDKSITFWFDLVDRTGRLIADFTRDEEQGPGALERVTRVERDDF